MASIAKRIRASLGARKKTFLLKHYWLTDGYWKIRKLKDSHNGERCFIIGNGPSLQATDLDQLEINKEISFAFNRIYHIFDQTVWRPTYYMSQDEKMLKGALKEVNQMGLAYKFIPIQNKSYYDIHIDGAIHYKLIHKSLDGTQKRFTTDAASGICAADTVVYSAMQLAVYMGFKEIYLLGIDHSFAISVNDAGEITYDPNAKDYFCDGYNKDKDQLYIPNPDRSTIAYLAARAYAEEHGISIQNATRGGKLEVFERVDFDSLFSFSDPKLL